jgi:hypothetical protein
MTRSPISNHHRALQLQPKIKIDFFYDTLTMLTPYILRPTPYALQPKTKIEFFHDTLAMLAPYSYSLPQKSR